MVIDLTKWPRLLASGDPVTMEQANDILIRTNRWAHLSSYDRDWFGDVTRMAHEILGFPLEPPYPTCPNWRSTQELREARDAHWDAMRAWPESIGAIHLEYLNNSRIVSSWIGGPYGWCAWDGRIFCSTHNIGKWPSIDEITAEWKLIAQAWPFLRLTAQVVTNEGEGDVAAEWRIADGCVEVLDDIAPGRAMVATPSDPDIRALTCDGERGVVPSRLRLAMEQVAGMLIGEDVAL